MRGLDDSSTRGRAQLVLAAAAVIAVALAPVLLAYLQLGVHPDVRGPDPDPGENAERFLERATHEAGSAVTGVAWNERDEAVETVRERLDPRLKTLETAEVESGTVYEVEYDDRVAREWAREHCPRGTGRRFGACRANRGVVVQRRAGETTVLAVAYDVTVTSEDGHRELTFVVRVVGG